MVLCTGQVDHAFVTCHNAARLRHVHVYTACAYYYEYLYAPTKAGRGLGYRDYTAGKLKLSLYYVRSCMHMRRAGGPREAIIRSSTLTC